MQRTFAARHGLQIAGGAERYGIRVLGNGCALLPRALRHVSDAVMHIRPATKNDWTAIWRIIGPTIRAGETYALASSMTEADAMAYWLGDDRDTFVAEEQGQIVGTYYLRSNQAGGGSHICNCGYMTRADSVGRGVARAMCQHSLVHARQRGYRGMQFNFVVASNTRAVTLWESLGFAVVGRVPEAFQHPSLGFVDVLVMFRPL